MKRGETMRTKRETITDEEVEQEIAELRDDPDVKLAQLEIRIRLKRRRYLYNLRAQKERGEKLRQSGIDENILRGYDDEQENEDD